MVCHKTCIRLFVYLLKAYSSHQLANRTSIRTHKKLHQRLILPRFLITAHSYNRPRIHFIQTVLLFLILRIAASSSSYCFCSGFSVHYHLLLSSFPPTPSVHYHHCHHHHHRRHHHCIVTETDIFMFCLIVPFLQY